MTILMWHLQAASLYIGLAFVAGLMLGRRWRQWET
jgi:hypothetical protein